MSEEAKKLAIQAICEAAKYNANIILMDKKSIDLNQFATELCNAIKIIEGCESEQSLHQ